MTHPAPVQATPPQPFVDDSDFQLYVGDALDVLRTLPDESVHTVVTSPPYWGLRDYGTGSWAGGYPDCDHKQETRHQQQGATSQRQGRSNAEDQRNENFRDVCGKCGATRTDQQLGLEPTPEAYVARMVEVFREVRRVMRRDATLWLNLGDSFADKQLQGIPWRLAFALQDAGWYLRSEIIWAKKNCMPESVTDRPTKSHEQVFLLTRSPRYYFDQEAIREPHTPDGRTKTIHAHAVHNSHENYANMGTDQERWPNGGRNARSVWNIATQPYAEAHFATFPEELPRRCIAAGTSEHGCCPECGAPWEREMEREPNPTKGTTGPNMQSIGPHGETDARYRHHSGTIASPSPTMLGWRPTCDHGHEPTACVVLDPFSGSGTVALVARKLGRRSIGIELNPDYAQLASRRLQQLSLLA